MEIRPVIKDGKVVNEVGGFNPFVTPSTGFDELAKAINRMAEAVKMQNELLAKSFEFNKEKIVEKELLANQLEKLMRLKRNPTF